MRSEKVVLTNMCMIINDKNEVVMQRRKKSWIGCAFPGGHVEPTESIVESTIREVKEETNLDVYDLKFCGVKQWFKDDTRFICFLYKTNKFIGELSYDTEENFWFNLDDINELDLSSSFDKMLELFLSNDLNELYHKRNGEDIEYLFY